MRDPLRTNLGTLALPRFIILMGTWEVGTLLFLPFFCWKFDAETKVDVQHLLVGTSLGQFLHFGHFIIPLTGFVIFEILDLNHQIFLCMFKQKYNS